MAQAESEHRLAETSEIFMWRLQRTSKMGFGERLADQIAATEIDLHELERLISLGCRLRTAYRILRP